MALSALGALARHAQDDHYNRYHASNLFALLMFYAAAHGQSFRLSRVMLGWSPSSGYRPPFFLESFFDHPVVSRPGRTHLIPENVSVPMIRVGSVYCWLRPSD